MPVPSLLDILPVRRKRFPVSLYASPDTWYPCGLYATLSAALRKGD